VIFEYFLVLARQITSIGGALTSQDLLIDTKFNPLNSCDTVPLNVNVNWGRLVHGDG